ncbi:MAG: hypothetical protein K2J04_02805, partial [Lachnospiraceae bacterium]|nr:hypothetical protein [Lachnospiraceae bacterium]
MKKKTKAWILVLICIVLIVIMGYLMIGNPFIFINNQKLKKSISSLDDSKIVSLNEVIPFEWDSLYTFEPYQSKAEIAEIIGFQSNDIKENNINEGMVHLLFVKNDKIVASILSYSSNLGYNIDFSSKANLKVTHTENAQFYTTKDDGITILTYIK